MQLIFIRFTRGSEFDDFDEIKFNKEICFILSISKYIETKGLIASPLTEDNM